MFFNPDILYNSHISPLRKLDHSFMMDSFPLETIGGSSKNNGVFSRLDRKIHIGIKNYAIPHLDRHIPLNPDLV